MSNYGGGNESSHVSVGPWGGGAGARWDDGVYSAVRQVIIFHGAAIDSIQIEYDQNCTSVWSEKHGGTGGIKTNKIKLESPDEYLVSISGHYGGLVESGPPLVRSIVLQSNRRKYGPFGIQQGTHFSVPVAGAKVVGFHGRSSWYLDSIGVHLKHFLPRNPSKKPEFEAQASNNKKTAPVINGTVKAKQAVTYGPWGGSGGDIFDDGVYAGVREVHLTRTKGLVSIRVCYDLNGNAVWGEKNGGTGGIRLDRIAFDYPSEVLTHITGCCGPTILRGPTIVRSITFHTNRRKYGPFGDEQGTSFSSGSNNGKIVGFHGRSGGPFVDSIGVHVMEGIREVKFQQQANPAALMVRGPSYAPIIAREPRSPRLYNDSFDMTREVKFQQEANPAVMMVREPSYAPPVIIEEPYSRHPAYDDFFNGMREMRFAHEAKPITVREAYPAAGLTSASWRSGLWGGERGQPWDDGIFYGVKKIFLTRGEAICCIQFEYDGKGGQSVWSARHGGGSEVNSHSINFEYPQEVLTAVSGYHGSLTGGDRSDVIKSLTFHTNKGKYGPYGEERGAFFTSTAEGEGRIVGFHGRSGCYLNALGIHMQQQQQQQQQPVFYRGLESSMVGDRVVSRHVKTVATKLIKSSHMFST
ncbi:unnamed protein product [Linum tenue]|uniref:Jacalin-type lectin domain-containing protein n=1 Tax=Linum tenue TaxID=586396 RepID=A0AAV0LRA1_9ROSI|nr:unnamed protein product [Linum tenue]